MLFFCGPVRLRAALPRTFKKGFPGCAFQGVGLARPLPARTAPGFLPFAAAGSPILAITALRDKWAPGFKKLRRCAGAGRALWLLAAGVLTFSAVNYAWYRVFAVSDFSSGSFAAAIGAMTQGRAWAMAAAGERTGRRAGKALRGGAGAGAAGIPAGGGRGPAEQLSE